MNLNGASDSKPTQHGDTSVGQLRHKPTKLRRFMSIGSRSRGDTRLNKHHKPVMCDNTAPMQTISPRPIEPESRPKTQLKRSISNFLLSRTSTNTSEAAKGEDFVHTVRGRLPTTEHSSMMLPLAVTRRGEDTSKGQGHLPLAGDPYQFVHMQSRKDSAVKSFYDLPTAASRSAALSSHPVRKEDMRSGDERPSPGELGGRQREKGGDEDAY